MLANYSVDILASLDISHFVELSIFFVMYDTMLHNFLYRELLILYAVWGTRWIWCLLPHSMAGESALVNAGYCS